MKKPMWIILAAVLAAPGAIAQDSTDGAPGRLQGTLDRLYQVLQRSPERTRSDAMPLVLQAQKLAALWTDPPAARTASDEEVRLLAVQIAASAAYPDQRVQIIVRTQGLRLWTRQAAWLLVPIREIPDRLDAAALLYPSLMDPANFPQIWGPAPGPVTPPKETKPARGRISDDQMPGLITRLKAAWPYRGQRLLLETLAAQNQFTMAQIRDLLGVLDFPKDRKDALALLLPQVIDPDHVDLLFEMFWTQADQEDLRKLLPAAAP